MMERRTVRTVRAAALAIALCAWTLAAGGADLRGGSAADAGEDDVPEHVCKKCASTGREECDQHDRHECALEDDVLFCSVVADCVTCQGTGFVDCKFCDNEHVQDGMERRRKDIARRGEQLAWIEKELEKPVRVAESEHFVIIWESREMKVDKVKRNPHEMLHITAARMEALFDLYLDKLGAREGDFAEKPLIAVWWDDRDQKDASARLCGNANSLGVKLYTVNPRYSTSGHKRHFKDDEALHRNLVHNATHLLLSHQRPSYWIGNDKKGWADAGLAHWFEFELTGSCRTYCYEEVNTKRDFKGGKFKVGVRKLVALNKQPAMSAVMQKKTTELTPEEHAAAFSYVDYLMQRDGKKLNDLLRRLRQREETRDALQATFGLSILELEELWKAWVLETYPTR